jgi:hypothetical protein
MTHSANAVVAGDALELALSGVTGTRIDVVGGRARQLITWLRRGGHDARALDTSSTARTQSRGDDRVSSGIVVTTDWTREADPIKLFRSLKRQLTPDGRLVVIAPNLTYIGVRLSPSQRRTRSPLPHPFTAADVEGLLNRAGFVVVDVQRQVDRVGTLRRLRTSRPAAVLDVLADDADALTSHFVFVAAPCGSPGDDHIRSQLRELADEQALAVRQAHRLGERVAALEARLEGGNSRASVESSNEGLAEARQALAAGIAEVKSLVAQLERRRYEHMVGRVCRVVSRDIPRGATVAVLTRGDEALLQFDRRRGVHFPQTDDGVYAGYHPADSNEAIAQLEAVRGRGAQYLVVPATAYWWLEYYREFHDYLVHFGRPVLRDTRTCAVFALDAGETTR